METLHSHVGLIPPLLEARDVARILAIPVRSVYQLAETGEIEFVRIGKRRVRFDREALARYIEARRHEAEPGGANPG